jgi:hypothetical protein
MRAVARGQAAVVDLDRGERFTGVVEHVSADRVAVAAVARLPAGPAELAGVAGSVAVATPRGVVRCRALVLGADPAGVVELGVTGEVAVDQRREHVRIDLRLPGVVRPRHAAHGALHTYTLDVSGGGVLVAGAGRAEIGEAVSVLVKLPGSETLEAAGRVARRSRSGHVALAFEAIDEERREALVRFLFEQQRLALRAARDGER